MKLEIGQSSAFTKTISESDVYGFAGLVGDFNSAHINQTAAKESIFGDRIAHGMLVGSLISSVLGMQLPGPGTVYLEQSLIFKKPVYMGDTATARVTVKEILNEKKGIYKMETSVTNQHNDVVIDGYAVVMYQDPAEEKA